MKVYFQNSFVSLEYDNNAQLGKAVWRGHLRGAELREAYLLSLDLIERFYLTSWLGDDRLMQSIAPEDLQWSLDVFIPRLVNSSLLRLARLPSFSETNRDGIREMIIRGHTYDINLRVRDFIEEQEALNWLLEKPEAPYHL
ncbi:hypothetical protein FVR03_02655 [Pontibacter qinzhouensis]|uniref:STAS/SEC14 domain-containing protein n=2 Tax=Pontibacter qinzhouensis TaxID=2603253 RepID=A0A5C8KCR2_9BACT|nr:hypothetical protein FVR03_02655 [Pontibacter qinzhouensis]